MKSALWLVSPFAIFPFISNQKFAFSRFFNLRCFPPYSDEQPQAANATFNMSQCLEYAFDMDAEIEPAPIGDHYSMDLMDNDFGNDFDDLTQEDRVAISACKGLRRKATIIEDLRPADATKLEYSYRPLDNINQYWAGPSYWKFRKSRKLTAEHGSAEGSSIAPTTHARRKVNRSRYEPIKFTKMTESVCETPAADFDEDFFITVDSKQALKFKKVRLTVDTNQTTH